MQDNSSKVICRDPIEEDPYNDSNHHSASLIKGTDNRLQHQHSNQQNTQDLDQQQQVDVKPSQVNVQNLEVIVNTKLENYCGKLTGNVYKKDTLCVGAVVALFFGSESRSPVYRTETDENGTFVFDDLPPGFYTIKAILRGQYGSSIPNIKLLPGQTVYQNIQL